MLLMLPVTLYMKEDEGTFLSNWESRKGRGGEGAVMTTLDGGWIHKWDNLDKLGIAQMSTIPAFLCGKRQIYLGYQTAWTLERR